MQIEKMDLESFLIENSIPKENWERANFGFDDLKKIALDHMNNKSGLDETGQLVANLLQKCNKVHSVRWRIKNPMHLMEKIVRKRAKKSEKYEDISIDNYAELVTDLLGVRVLHLFKYEWEDIHDYILNNWLPKEKTVAYKRSGDEGDLINSYIQKGCEVKNHPDGYRSIHYVISSQPTIRKIFFEIQVRTIFEEGWSEIDHKIRYPNVSTNERISYFLNILNRMAGSADEMGTFVMNLKSDFSVREHEQSERFKEHERHLSQIETLAVQLSKEQQQSDQKDKLVNELNAEIEQLRKKSFISVTDTDTQPYTTLANSPRSTGLSPELLDAIAGPRLSCADGIFETAAINEDVHLENISGTPRQTTKP